MQDKLEELMEEPRQWRVHHQHSESSESDYIDIDSLEWVNIVGTITSEELSKGVFYVSLVAQGGSRGPHYRGAKSLYQYTLIEHSVS